MKEVYRSRAPLRLGLAGGGTDVSPFSDEYGGYVLNATVALYSQAILQPTKLKKIEFIAADLQQAVEMESSIELPETGNLLLHKGIYNSLMRRFNITEPLSFRLTTYADAPAGSGLGTSSTMVVCIVQAFAEWLRLGLGEYELANLAYEIERTELNLAGGKQDQYAASFGGFNFMEFGPGERILVNPLRVPSWIVNELEASTVLFYTGQSRSSSKIIEHQIKQARNAYSQSQQAMLKLKQSALQMKAALLLGDFDEYARLLADSWESKKKLASTVSNENLNKVYDLALNAGATAGKLSGAGGGGFFMFYVKPQKRMNVVRALNKLEGQVINFRFELQGAQSWKFSEN